MSDGDGFASTSGKSTSRGNYVIESSRSQRGIDSRMRYLAKHGNADGSVLLHEHRHMRITKVVAVSHFLRDLVLRLFGSKAANGNVSDQRQRNHALLADSGFWAVVADAIDADRNQVSRRELDKRRLRLGWGRKPGQRRGRRRLGSFGYRPDKRIGILCIHNSGRQQEAGRSE